MRLGRLLECGQEFLHTSCSRHGDLAVDDEVWHARHADSAGLRLFLANVFNAGLVLKKCLGLAAVQAGFRHNIKENSPVADVPAFSKVTPEKGFYDGVL